MAQATDPYKYWRPDAPGNKNNPRGNRGVYGDDKERAKIASVRPHILDCSPSNAARLGLIYSCVSGIYNEDIGRCRSVLSSWGIAGVG